MTSTWQALNLIVLLTCPLEQVQKLAIQAGNPHADDQILEKELILIRATRDFEYALIQWEDKSQDQKTWGIFKMHFDEVQLQLKKTRRPTMQQVGYYHANILV